MFVALIFERKSVACIADLSPLIAFLNNQFLNFFVRMFLSSPSWFGISKKGGEGTVGGNLGTPGLVVTPTLYLVRPSLLEHLSFSTTINTSWKSIRTRTKRRERKERNEILEKG